MSELNELIASSAINAYNSGLQKGHQLERDRIIRRMNDYFELVEYSTEVEGANPSEEWDAGFQAAIALVVNDPNATDYPLTTLQIIQKSNLRSSAS
jgi:hypothetical protein